MAGGGAVGRLAAEKQDRNMAARSGQHIVADHSQSNQELQAIANQQIWHKLDPASVATEQRLQASSGPAFDAAHARDMVEDIRRTSRTSKTRALPVRFPR